MKCEGKVNIQGGFEVWLLLVNKLTFKICLILPIDHLKGSFYEVKCRKSSLCRELTGMRER